MTTHSSSSLRADIQGLRALAVVLVIANHAVQWPAGGFVGVDVFFVISGFLITGILLREYDGTGRISLTNFYRRRIRRILPTATVVILVTIIAAYFLFPVARFRDTTIDGFWSAVFLGNWHMAAVGVDYFQLGQPPSALQHYWSLSVEEQFYFVWPWLMLALLVLFRKFGRHAVIAAVGIIIAGSLIWSLVETAGQPTLAYFSTLSRAWELGAGALLALMAPSLTRLRPVFRPVLGWVGLAGIVGSTLIIDSSVRFPAPWALLPVAATMMVIAAGTGDDSRVWPLTNRISTYLGDISFSLYLWHFPVLILLISVMPSGSMTYVLVTITLTFALSVASFHAIENAFRDRKPGKLGGPTARAWARTLTVLILLGSVTVAVLAFTVDRGPQVMQPISSPDSKSPEDMLASCFGANFVANNCQVDETPTVMSPTLGGLNADLGDTFLCFRDRDQPMKTCHYGSDKEDAIRVALVGDSHAAQLLTPLRGYAADHNWSLDTYVGYGCQWQEPAPTDCQVMSDIVSGLKNGEYDVIITSGARFVGNDTVQTAERYKAAWENIQGPQLVVIADVPTPSDEALACIARVGFNLAKNRCGTPQELALAKPDPLLVAASSVDRSGVSLVDTMSFYCQHDFCPSVIGGVQVYRDTGAHLSATWLKSLGPYLLKQIVADINSR